MDDEFREILIDEAVLAGDDAMAAIDQIWWLANIYDGQEDYERSLQPFSLPLAARIRDVLV